jgi:hypothetical protein
MLNETSNDESDVAQSIVDVLSVAQSKVEAFKESSASEGIVMKLSEEIFGILQIRL